MGMDVYGKNPTHPDGPGHYFRQSVWGWHPLWDACEMIAPEITNRVEYAHTNDGDGLNAQDSRALADKLQAAIDSGELADLIAAKDAAEAALPDEPCVHCKGTGTRSDAIGVEHGQTTRVIPSDALRQDKHRQGQPHPRAGQTGWCNGCDGRGVNRPWSSHYDTSVKEVQEFVEFLRECGGFEIL